MGGSEQQRPPACPECQPASWSDAGASSPTSSRSLRSRLGGGRWLPRWLRRRAGWRRRFLFFLGELPLSWCRFFLFPFRWLLLGRVLHFRARQRHLGLRRWSLGLWRRGRLGLWFGWFLSLRRLRHRFWHLRLWGRGFLGLWCGWFLSLRRLRRRFWL